MLDRQTSNLFRVRTPPSNADCRALHCDNYVSKKSSRPREKLYESTDASHSRSAHYRCPHDRRWSPAHPGHPAFVPLFWVRARRLIKQQKIARFDATVPTRSTTSDDKNTVLNCVSLIGLGGSLNSRADAARLCNLWKNAELAYVVITGTTSYDILLGVNAWSWRQSSGASRQLNVDYRIFFNFLKSIVRTRA